MRRPKPLLAHERVSRKPPKIINKLDSVSSKSRRILTQNFQSGTTDFLTVKVAKVGNEVSPVKTLEIQINSILMARHECALTRQGDYTLGSYAFVWILFGYVVTRQLSDCYFEKCDPTERSNPEAGK